VVAANSLSAPQALAHLQWLGACDQLSAHPALAHSALLQDFSAPQADQLGMALQRVSAQPGQVLIAQGQINDWMLVLLEGTVDVVKYQPGHEQATTPDGANRIAVVTEGAVLGEMSMFDNEPRYASCIAITPVQAAVLTRAAVADLIAQYPAVAAKLLVKLNQLLAQRLRNTSNQVVKLLRIQ
jgi:CRP/FNR family transcriptional regulator, cyclic AMP receptor protein